LYRSREIAELRTGLLGVRLELKPGLRSSGWSTPGNAAHESTTLDFPPPANPDPIPSRCDRRPCTRSHGRIANRPAAKVSVTRGRVAFRASPRAGTRTPSGR